MMGWMRMRTAFLDDCEPPQLNENNTSNESESLEQPPTNNPDGSDNTTGTGTAGEVDASRWADGASLLRSPLLIVSALLVARRKR